MPKHPWEPRSTLPRGLVEPVRVDPAGVSGPTRGQSAGPHWRRTSPGFFVPSSVDPGVPEQRIIEVGPLLGSRGAVTGWAALRLLGAGFCDGLDSAMSPIPVPIAVGTRGRLRPRAGVVPDHSRLRESDLGRIVRGVRLVRVERAVIDAMRWACDVREAVVELEKVLAAELTSREEVATYLATVRGMHGQAQVKDALLLARENSRSPQETRLRLIAELDAGLPPLAVNAWIHALDGRCLGEADLLDEGAGLVIEFDGADHRGKKRQSRDAVKDDDLRDRDVEVMRVTGEQLDDVGRLVARIHAARRRAKFVAPAQRRWIVRRRPEDLHVRLLRARQEAAVLERMERIGGQWPPPAADGLPNA